MMIPEPWEHHDEMDAERKAFYRYNATRMEPWDGPASIAFTDGTVMGAVLDRNGLRPSRYWVTKDGLVVMASEVGVVDLAQDTIVEKGRLQPGRMFLIDTREVASSATTRSRPVSPAPARMPSGSNPNWSPLPICRKVSSARAASRRSRNSNKSSATRSRRSS